MTFDPILSACALFEGLSEAGISKALSCMSAREARCRRGQYLLHTGDPVRTPGVVLSGEVESVDVVSIRYDISAGRRAGY